MSSLDPPAEPPPKRAPRDPSTGRFRIGVSGNPRGRPAGGSPAARAILAALSAPVTVEGEGGRPLRLSKLAAAARHVADQGVAGDVRAGKLALDLALKAEERAPSPPAPAPAAAPPSLAEADAAMLQRLIERVRRLAETA